MKNKNIITKIAVAQTFGTHQIVIGEGLIPISKSDQPYRVIDNQPVFLRGFNAFDLPLEFNIRKVYKWGEYYDSYLMDGMPPLGGTVKLYVDTSLNELFFNGTLDGTTQDLMDDATFSSIQSFLTNNADKINAQIQLQNPTFSVVQLDPWNLEITLNTTLIVKDKSTVVIGGLIDDSFSETEYKVPCLGDIPLLNFLFKSTSRAADKTNLFIFITPHVVKHPAEAVEIFQKKKDQIDQIKEGNIKMYDKNSP